MLPGQGLVQYPEGQGRGCDYRSPKILMDYMQNAPVKFIWIVQETGGPGHPRSLSHWAQDFLPPLGGISYTAASRAAFAGRQMEKYHISLALSNF